MREDVERKEDDVRPMPVRCQGQKRPGTTRANAPTKKVENAHHLAPPDGDQGAHKVKVSGKWRDEVEIVKELVVDGERDALELGAWCANTTSHHQTITNGRMLPMYYLEESSTLNEQQPYVHAEVQWTWSLTTCR
ncbi:hypothetical protein CYMTET_11732 [Cymbomonas tetramitiformis]|uniref:Uncharacterized protein n=1 Tax=Cymbomonas tetramitiformis TaxID=36881 RepID=A0AAE0GLG0_9CHLO|nr:hypothetical protein CYMTET_11732 [Cymbomonas tetramitiformis]